MWCSYENVIRSVLCFSEMFDMDLKRWRRENVTLGSGHNTAQTDARHYQNWKFSCKTADAPNNIYRSWRTQTNLSDKHLTHRVMWKGRDKHWDCWARAAWTYHPVFGWSMPITRRWHHSRVKFPMKMFCDRNLTYRPEERLHLFRPNLKQMTSNFKQLNFEL